MADFNLYQFAYTNSMGGNLARIRTSEPVNIAENSLKPENTNYK